MIRFFQEFCLSSLDKIGSRWLKFYLFTRVVTSFLFSLWISFIELRTKIFGKMISKAIILSVFVCFATAEIPENLLATAVAAAANPCEGLHNVFATNTRGCSWYHVCIDEVSVDQNRCPEGHQFNFASQNCPPRGTVECTLDRVVEPECPANSQGIIFAPHPYSCSKFISKYLNVWLIFKWYRLSMSKCYLIECFK